MKIVKLFFSVSSGTIFIYLLGISLVMNNCSKDSTSGEDFVFPDSNLSFQKHIQPEIFIPYCANPGCHSTVDRANGLDLETPTPTFINDMGDLLVIPGDANQSRLFQVLLGPIPPDIERMPPPGRTPLSDNMIKAIRTWINEGADINK
jgi:hypothetical protein